MAGINPSSDAVYIANTFRRVMLAFALSALTLTLFGVLGPHAIAQSRVSPLDLSWGGLSMQIHTNANEIAQIKRSLEKLEAAKIPERMALIEYKLDRIEWLSNAIIIGLMGLMVERFWPRRKTE